jgi:uncharacterized protein (DUF1499 family)
MDKFGRLVWLVSVLAVGCSGARPAGLGVKEGKLAACPKSPNCVSTQSSDEEHRIDAISYTSSLEEARDRVEKIVRGMPRTRVVSLEKDYMHVECTSRIFRFVDDVEFWFDEPNKVIHFRSASRVGYSDLGVNRKRMEEIRARFIEGQLGP